MDLIVGLYLQFGDRAGARSLDRNLHFHGLQYGDHVALLDDRAHRRRHLPHVRGHLSSDFSHDAYRSRGYVVGYRRIPMKFTLLAALVGIAAGLAGGGRLGRLSRTNARWWALPVLWAACFVVAGRWEVHYGFEIFVAGHVLLLVFALVNFRRVAGIWLVALGALCNLTVIAVNHGTPYRLTAMRDAGIHADQPHSVFRSTKVSHPEQPSDQLTMLGDILAVAPVHEVLSFGDLFLAFGSAIALFHALTRRAGERRYRPRHTASGINERVDLFLDLRETEPVLELPTIGPGPGDALDDPSAGDLFWKTRAEVLGANSASEEPCDPDDVLVWARRDDAATE